MDSLLYREVKVNDERYKHCKVLHQSTAFNLDTTLAVANQVAAMYRVQTITITSIQS